MHQLNHVEINEISGGTLGQWVTDLSGGLLGFALVKHLHISAAVVPPLLSQGVQPIYGNLMISFAGAWIGYKLADTLWLTQNSYTNRR